MSSSSTYPYCACESVLCCTPNRPSPGVHCTLSILCTLPVGELRTIELDTTVFLTGTQVDVVHWELGSVPQGADEFGVPPQPEVDWFAEFGVEPQGEVGGVPAMEFELRRPPDEILVRRGPAAEGLAERGPTAEKGDEAEGGDEPKSQPCLLFGEVLILPPEGDPLLVRRIRAPTGDVLNFRSRTCAPTGDVLNFRSRVTPENPRDE